MSTSSEKKGVSFTIRELDVGLGDYADDSFGSSSSGVSRRSSSRSSSRSSDGVARRRPGGARSESPVIPSQNASGEFTPHRLSGKADRDVTPFAGRNVRRSNGDTGDVDSSVKKSPSGNHENAPDPGAEEDIIAMRLLAPPVSVANAPSRASLNVPIKVFRRLGGPNEHSFIGVSLEGDQRIYAVRKEPLTLPELEDEDEVEDEWHGTLGRKDMLKAARGAVRATVTSESDDDDMPRVTNQSTLSKTDAIEAKKIATDLSRLLPAMTAINVLCGRATFQNELWFYWAERLVSLGRLQDNIGAYVIPDPSLETHRPAPGSPRRRVKTEWVDAVNERIAQLMIRQLAETLETLHRLGVGHGRIDPTSVFLDTPEDRLIVCLGGWCRVPWFERLLKDKWAKITPSADTDFQGGSGKKPGQRGGGQASPKASPPIARSR